jgi:methionine sulfoxide reductase heme-binding subunit
VSDQPSNDANDAASRATFAWDGFLRRALKSAVLLLCLYPIAWIALQLAILLQGGAADLGANPVEFIIRYLGDWALRLLLIALAITPLRIVTGWNIVARLRRMLGLFAFFYVCIHIMSYVGLDHRFDWAAIWADIVKRTYITVGMAALVMLTPLAVTSTDKMIRRLGGALWRKLHMLVYPASIAGVIHYFLMIKAGFQQPLLYAVILTILFGIRFYKKRA